MSSTKKLTVSESFIKEIHEQACSEWKEKIEAEYPDVFIKPLKAFNFGNAYEIATSAANEYSVPAIIGFGLLPENLEHLRKKILVVSKFHDLEIMDFTDTFGEKRKGLVFTPKK